jgi:hypothetical protein
MRRESPVTLAREALWRTQKRWRQQRLPQQLEKDSCPVSYRTVGYHQAQLEQVGSRERKLILRYANAVCAGQFPWFAYGSVFLEFPPSWNLDFISGTTWPDSPARMIEVVRHDGSDVKVPWELSRLQFLPVLAKAWRLTGDAQYREAGKELLLDWIEKNPPGIGINWTIAMEPALRAISVCLFLDLLSPFSEAEQAWTRLVTRSLWQHLLFIEAHNEFSHFARSNHYLSNIVGLFCLASHLDGPRMDLRRRRHTSLIEREMLCQVYDDGGHYEASTGYHLLCLEMFTHAFQLMRSAGVEPSPDFTHRLREMYRFLAALTDAQGKVPILGDCDDGRVELLSDDLEQMTEIPFDRRQSLAIADLLGIGESIFGENYGGGGSEAPWYQLASPSPENHQVARRHALFVHSGLAVAKNGSLDVVFAAMPNGIGGKGSHTHNDKLSLIVRIDNEELFSDSGTGCYTRNPLLRNQLRSTAAHNTIQIDKEEQNRFSVSPDGLFQITDDSRLSPIEVEEADGTIILRASHDGYGRLGVIHTRTATLMPQSCLIIEDLLSGSGNHDFEMFFHLARIHPVEIEQARGKELRCRISLDRRSVQMVCRAPVELEIACIPSKISTAYGLTRDATTVVVSGHLDSPVTLSSTFEWLS